MYYFKTKRCASTEKKYTNYKVDVNKNYYLFSSTIQREIKMYWLNYNGWWHVQDHLMFTALHLAVITTTKPKMHISVKELTIIIFLEKIGSELLDSRGSTVRILDVIMYK